MLKKRKEHNLKEKKSKSRKTSNDAGDTTINEEDLKSLFSDSFELSFSFNFLFS